MAFNPDPKIKSVEKESWHGKMAVGYNQIGLKGWRSKSKYKNVKQEYNGIKYDSIFEAKAAQDLDWKLKVGLIKEWRRQVKIDLKVNDVHITNYYIDFIYVDQNDTVVYLEVKGFETEVWRIKWKLLCALINEIEPGAELIVLKQK